MPTKHAPPQTAVWAPTTSFNATKSGPNKNKSAKGIEMKSQTKKTVHQQGQHNNHNVTRVRSKASSDMCHPRENEGDSGKHQQRGSTIEGYRRPNIVGRSM
jgi:hypothetical protein